jgi:hypothetical protein
MMKSSSAKTGYATSKILSISDNNPRVLSHPPMMAGLGVEFRRNVPRHQPPGTQDFDGRWISANSAINRQWRSPTPDTGPPPKLNGALPFISGGTGDWSGKHLVVDAGRRVTAQQCQSGLRHRHSMGLAGLHSRSVNTASLCIKG